MTSPHSTGGFPLTAAMACGGGTGRALLSLSISSSSALFSRTLFSSARACPFLPRVYLGFNRTRCLSTAPAAEAEQATQSLRHSVLLERLRVRHLKDAAKRTPSSPASPAPITVAVEKKKKEKKSVMACSFEELGLSEEVMGAVNEMGISVPTEIQCIGVRAVLEGKSVVLGSHTGSGKTLAYMLPIVQVFLTFPYCFYLRILSFSVVNMHAFLEFLFTSTCLLKGLIFLWFNQYNSQSNPFLGSFFHYSHKF